MRRRGNYKFLEKFSWYVPGVGGMLALLGWLLVGGLLGGLAMVFLSFIPAESSKQMAGIVSYVLMFVPPMIYASSKSGRQSMNTTGYKLDSKNFAPVGAALCTVMAIVGTIAMSFWADAFTPLLPEMPSVLRQALEELTQGPFWLNFISVSILAPLCEEWLCRGMVLRGLLAGSRMKPAVAILISSLFFALIHLNPWQAIPAFLMGCLFGYVYYKTGSLKLTMLMHFTNNTFALICGHIDALKELNSWADFFEPRQYAILVAATVIVTVLVVLSFRKVQLKAPQGNFDEVPSLFDSKE